MITILAIAVATACTTEPMLPGPMGSVHAGSGIYMAAGTTGTLWVDGQEVGVDIVALDGPGGAELPTVWLPDVPLEEGQAWEWQSDRGPVDSGEVRGPRVLDDFALIDVVHGDRERGGGGSCLSTGTYRRLDVSLNREDGPGSILDVDTGEIAYYGWIYDPNVAYVREGFEKRETCLQAFWLEGDGATAESDVVCSTDTGCNTTGGGSLGILALMGLGLVRRLPR